MTTESAGMAGEVGMINNGAGMTMGDAVKSPLPAGEG